VTDPRIEAWAQVLTSFSVAVEPGDRVAIVGGVAAEPLLRATYRAVLDRGGFPVMFPELAGVHADLLRFGSPAQLEAISPIERFVRAEADVSIRISAETNTRSAAGLDPERGAIFNRARADLRQTFFDRAARGEHRWTLTLFPTDAYAQDAEMSTDEFAEFVFRACKLNVPDPVAAWQQVHQEQARLIDWLRGKRQLRFVGPGTDLSLTIEDRTWSNSDGKRNFPSGEIFTGPVETSARGLFTCTFPVVTAGRGNSGIRLRFEDGVVVDAQADKNEEYLIKSLETDDGARRLGEVALGTNFDITGFTRQILFDEKIGGTVHVALGAGYPETGSINRSAIHWDLICDLRQGGRVEADGEPMMIDGRFVI
jgi:aminopeptidase